MTQAAQKFRFGRFWFDATRGDLHREGTAIAAGGQALEVLALLLARPGQLVTKDEIMAKVWPDLTAEEGNIPVQIHRLRQLLDDHAKPHRWIVTVPGRGYRFVGEVTASPSPSPSSRPAAPFIGRERDLAALQAAMPRHQLVTVTGPGGIGKTRLALEFMREHGADPQNKILLLPLEGLRQRDQMFARLAARLGLPLADGPELARAVPEALRRDPCVLVFDNAEHVLAETAALAAAILDRAAGASILVTSREPLKLPGELVIPLGPLPVPDEAAGAAQIGASAAVRLFAANAEAARPGFTVSGANATEVAAICRKLEGVPLALQLAASWAGTLELPALRQSLDVPGLAPPALPHLPARHRTVAATMAWSVALLTEHERAALRRLSVYAGGFTPSGAASVIMDQAVAADDVPGLTNALLEKSLLFALPAQGKETRLRMLESTRQFAQEMLAEAGEARAVQQQFAARMVAAFGAARESWPVTDSEAWFSEFEPEIDNLRAALDWTLGPQGNPALAVALAATLRAPAVDRLLTMDEFLAATAAALKLIDDATPLETAAFIRFSASFDLAAGMTAPVAQLALAMDGFAQAGNPGMAGLAAARAAVLSIMAGDDSAARQFLDAGIAALAHLPANRLRSGIMTNTGTAYAMLGGAENLQAARDFYGQALPLAQRFKDHSQIAMIGANIAELDAVLGDYAAAITRCETLAATSRARRDWRRLSFVLSNRMNYHLLANDLAGAIALGPEAITQLRGVADPNWSTDHGAIFALIAARRGDTGTAAKLAGLSAHYYASRQKARPAIERRIWSALTKELAPLRDAERRRLMDEGAALSFAQGLDMAEELLVSAAPTRLSASFR
jgi:predicted ATPase